MRYCVNAKKVEFVFRKLDEKTFPGLASFLVHKTLETMFPFENWKAHACTTELISSVSAPLSVLFLLNIQQDRPTLKT